MKIRFGDRYIERPFRELALEALFAPLMLYLFWEGTKGGWGL